MEQNNSLVSDSSNNDTNVEPIVVPDIETSDIDLTCILTECYNPLINQENFTLDTDSNEENKK